MIENKKKLLYIGAPMVNYHTEIISEFENQGYAVDFYDDRPSQNSFLKGIIKIKKTLVNTLIEKYFEHIINETKKTKYDLVFIIDCKVFTYEMIERLKDTQRFAKFVLYMWDSFALYPNSKNLIPLFDKTYSFDTYDCENTKTTTLLPLFYIKAYEEIGYKKISGIQYDIMSICTVHPNRYVIMKELFPSLEANGIKIFSYMFLNRLQYIYNKFFIPEFKNTKMNEFKFTPLSVMDCLNILKISNSVFDVQHNMQNGLTMRTFETLGAKRKLITFNANIKKYDFYDENNILVIDKINSNTGNDIIEFLEHDYIPINNDIYAKYSLSCWIKTIIDDVEEHYFI
ncbi:MAG: hypothetical protein FWG34_11205 [Oscillospiraceae bacterium]|nr:hypothetical protein [Oscillospiraceae bacterium]